MKIEFLPEALNYFNKLTEILYEEGYFGLEENSYKYVDNLIAEIIRALPIRQKKKAPQYFNRYGTNMYYVTIRKNRRTQWYVFFTMYKEFGDTTYLIRHISNNHISAHYL